MMNLLLVFYFVFVLAVLGLLGAAAGGRWHGRDSRDPLGLDARTSRAASPAT